MNSLQMVLEVTYVTNGLTPTAVEGVDFFFRNYTLKGLITYTLPLGAVPAEWNVHYTVINPSNQYITYPVTTCDVAPNAIQFTPTELGNYTVQCTIEDTNTGNMYEESLTVGCWNFLTSELTACGSFIITNNSPVDVSISVDGIDDSVVITDQNIPTTESYTLEVTDPLIYFLTATYIPVGEIDEVEEVYVLNNYCAVNDCISSYILDVVCEDTRECKECPSETDLNQLLLLVYTYTMKLNEEYGISNFYTTLNQSQLQDFTTIQSVMDRLVKFCNRRNCAGVSNNNPGYSWSNSGCTSCN
jgi:hypothetical protein